MLQNCAKSCDIFSTCDMLKRDEKILKPDRSDSDSQTSKMSLKMFEVFWSTVGSAAKLWAFCAALASICCLFEASHITGNDLQDQQSRLRQEALQSVQTSNKVPTVGVSFSCGGKRHFGPVWDRSSFEMKPCHGSSDIVKTEDLFVQSEHSNRLDTKIMKRP